MSKVLIDRELLERAMYAKDGKELIYANRELRAILDQPAEAEGVELRRYTPISQGDHIPAMNSCDQGGWVRHSDHIAALSASTAERDAWASRWEGAVRHCAEVEAERDQLRAEVEALRKDAERYRGCG